MKKKSFANLSKNKTSQSIDTTVLKDEIPATLYAGKSESLKRTSLRGENSRLTRANKEFVESKPKEAILPLETTKMPQQQENSYDDTSNKTKKTDPLLLGVLKNDSSESILPPAQIEKKVDSVSSQLDKDFYKDFYKDLAKLSDDDLNKHWEKHGSKEGRIPNLDEFAIKNGLSGYKDLDFELDLIFYRVLYNDLKSVTRNLYDAKLHWFKFGKKEGRYKNFMEWKAANDHGDFVYDIESIDWGEMLSKDIDVIFSDFMETLKGNMKKALPFKSNKKENSIYYVNMARKFYEKSVFTNNNKYYHSSLMAAKISYGEMQNVAALELMGESHFHHGDFNSALAAFNMTRDFKEGFSEFYEFNYAKACEKANDLKSAIKVISSGLKRNPNAGFLKSELDRYMQSFFWSYKGLEDSLAMMDKREDLLSTTCENSRFIYETHLNYFSGGTEVSVKPKLNTDKILIVGDFHVAQCVRYRIDQKVEQLEAQGKVVKTVDWTKLNNNLNQLALHDVVIFYRVPAVLEVLKAIAQINAAGKISLYEIDDLLFEKAYPAPIDTFGGYVDLATHIELRKSMSMFHAAAQCCRYGLASTVPLQEKLEKVVFGKKCYLHRNGLDKHNTIRKVGKSGKKTVDIFYGSGTQAHNSDFIDQALPAITRILTKYKQARLVIAGYLKLPQAFLDKFSTQVISIAPVSNIKAYWSYLDQADINLAVLDDDEINGCKSELKWFEAACFKIPSVLSSTQNYRDVIENGKDAFLVGNEIEWFNALEALILSPELRNQVGQVASEKVAKNYSIETLGKSFLMVLDAITQAHKAVAKKKKIALVNVFYPPQAIGGATRVVVDNVGELLKNHDDSVDLVVFTSEDNCTEPYQLTTYKDNGVDVYRTTILYREHMDWHPKDPEMYRLFSEFLALEQPDLIHFHCVQRLTGSIVEAAKDMAVPYIVTAHDAWWISDYQFLVDEEDNVYTDGHPDTYAPRVLPNNISLNQSLERISYFKDLLSGANSVLTVSESFADIYRKNGYENIQVNKNGISTIVDWSPKETAYTENVVCAHIGGMAQHKGYFLLKEAIEKSQPNNVEMLIVDHSKPSGYELKTTWGEVPVTFIGRIAQDRVVDLYKKIDVVFAPSMWPESYGLVTREAAACGCWVVASELGGIGEDVREGITGFKVAPELMVLTKVIETIDKQPRKYKQVIDQAGIRLVDQQVNELVAIYENKRLF